MASRTLTLALAADIDNLKKGLDDAEKVVNKSADQISDFGKKAALAFAAVGAAAVAFGVSAVRAAAEDEKARKSLEQTIRSNTKATEEQIAGLDDYISKQSIATATTDDVLRPAFARLVRSTSDVTKAQELLSLAQEISTATGKPLETVANALGKSFDGQNAALGKLGLGIDAATLKTMSHEQIMQQLKGTYNGFIANEATNAEFKFKQLTIALDETKEKMRRAATGIKFTEERKRKIGEKSRERKSWSVLPIKKSEQHRKNLSASRKNKISVICDGVLYDSQSAASRHYMFGVAEIRRRCLSDSYPNFRFA